MEATEIIVVGAGVSGLTTAVCLQEWGRSVRIYTRELRAATSCAAAAMWSPYGIDNDDRVARWSDTARRELSKLVVDIADPEVTGVRLVYGQEAAQSEVQPPAWAKDLTGFRVSDPHELPETFVTGWWYQTPVVDMPRYLAYLRRRFRAAGGELEVRAISSLSEPLAEARVVVNCTGVAARELVEDRSLEPNRGQLVVVRNPGVTEFFVQNEDGPETTYFIPHGDTVVLGGSGDRRRSDLVPDPAVAAAIVDRCAVIEPALAEAPVIEHRVGLRPERARIRVAREARDGGHVVHNYGHGGNGVTLSWGCARDAAALVQEVLG